VIVTEDLGPRAYDSLYLNDDFTYNQPLASPYYPLYRKVIDRATQAPIASILEVGCGSGVLAEMLIAAGKSYIGFDFNEIAVAKARKRNGEAKHFVADATDPSSYSAPYDTIVSCEVLEHIEGDLRAIELWRSDCMCICSVPNFDYPTHVRFFRSESEVTARYDRLLDIQSIERVPKSPIAGITWAQYFRRLRWSRNEPKKLLGLLGANTFDWHGGWFLFVARRR
jgi:2-polyprenyl-3-methyl-5-hydroxy-6-metoxy-1,4-benzoquinol methylase